jgi:ABC-type anion transport system duplicated permease subunit
MRGRMLTLIGMFCLAVAFAVAAIFICATSAIRGAVKALEVYNSSPWLPPEDDPAPY